MKIEEALQRTTLSLRGAGIENPRLEAEVMMDAVLGCGRVYLYTHGGESLTFKAAEALEAMTKRRRTHEPMAYILGHKEFMGLDFLVSPAVLIPRPDTESIVEAVLSELLVEGALGINPRILDCCTGSGAIGLSLKHYCPGARVTLSDVSEDALTMAKENAQALNLEVDFVQGDLLTPFAGEVFDLIIANPPYIPSAVIRGLEPDVRDYEPRLALDGGDSGFDLYHRLVTNAKDYLKDGGYLVMEAGDGQGEALLEKLEAQGYGASFTVKDLTGTLRGVGGENLSKH